MYVGSTFVQIQLQLQLQMHSTFESIKLLSYLEYGERYMH